VIFCRNLINKGKCSLFITNEIIMKCMLLILMGFAGLASYGKSHEESLAEFLGSGIVKMTADYLSLVITVHSECEPTPSDAQKDTDAVVKAIDDYLQTLETKDDQHFKILIDGGYTSSYYRWFKDHQLCMSSYQKVTQITLKISMRHDFDKIFSNIQTFVLDKFQQVPALDQVESPRTYVSIGIPNPELTRTHKREAEQQALGNAMEDAISKLKATFTPCELHFWKVQTINEEGSMHPLPRPQMSAMVAKSAALETNNVAPVRFDSLETLKTVKVTFATESTCFQK
jgi:uncharacterized protein YggE